MPSRSRMAALVIAVGSLSGAGLGTNATRADDAPVAGTVSLQLQINGLSAGDSTIEIKPGHPGCAFPPVTRRVRAAVDGSMVRLEPIAIEARSVGADRDCSFAITIHEPGQSPRTFRRGLRLSEPGADGVTTAQTLRLYLSAPSVATKDSPARPNR